jgi:hypothetical protein
MATCKLESKQKWPDSSFQAFIGFSYMNGEVGTGRRKELRHVSPALLSILSIERTETRLVVGHTRQFPK